MLDHPEHEPFLIYRCAIRSRPCECYKGCAETQPNPFGWGCRRPHP
jgi:hypothetical protein